MGKITREDRIVI